MSAPSTASALFGAPDETDDAATATPSQSGVPRIGAVVAPAPATVTIANAVFDAIERDGTDTVFGVPGSAITPLYQALKGRRRMRHVLAKSEAGAGFMAYGYAAVKRSIGVAMATTGPAATNLITPAACALADSVPMLLLTGQNATGYLGRNATQDSTVLGVDTTAMFRHVTRFSINVPSGAVAQRMIDRALREAHGGRSGPVHVSIPVDVQKQQLTSTADLGGRPSASRPVDLDAVGEALALLSQARQPAILAGHGVIAAEAWQPLLRFASRLRIPVATTPKAKGAFPESHPLSLGVLGLGGHPRAERYLLGGGCDVLLVLGSGLGELSTNHFDPRLSPRRALVQVDIDAGAIGRSYPVDLPVVGDLRAVLEAMLARAIDTGEDRSLAPEDPLAELRAAVPAVLGSDGLEGADSPLKPQRMARELEHALGSDGHLWVDIGTSILWAGHYLRCDRPGTYHLPLGFASMGTALAGAIGAKLAAPGAPVIALVGDGAFGMNGLEVHTAVEAEVPVVWVVANNGGHGMVYHGERMVFGEDLGQSRWRGPMDICGVARALGAEAVRVDSGSSLRSALERALRARGPVVIDAMIDAEEVPQPLAQRAQAVAGAVRR